MKKLIAMAILASTTQIGMAVTAQDLQNEINSRSYKLGNCMLILNSNAMFGPSQRAELDRILVEIKQDRKALKWAINFDQQLNQRNALNMFRSSERACKELGYSVK
jgi:hypothetical protein